MKRLSIHCPYCECGFARSDAGVELEGESKTRYQLFRTLLGHLIKTHPEQVKWEPE